MTGIRHYAKRNRLSAGQTRGRVAGKPAIFRHGRKAKRYPIVDAAMRQLNATG
ncbi:hypothetical protein KCP76_17720 [Salmonella enterica subsp. enterica serovar Weltevreden]|nr:hypothetical protein KCP76_17720 [Salmonella enterica subsp. enterica serovar Weltevreden]